MNTIFYQETSIKVVHRPIPSEFIYSVAHDYRSSLTPSAVVPREVPTGEERTKESLKVATAKADYLKFKGTPDHNEQRSDFIKAFLGARMPNWGSVKLSV